MDRTQLFDTLSNLPPATFERLLIAVNMPRMNRAGTSAKIGEQVSALLEWADSPIGPGVEAIAWHLTELNHFEFDAYLRSLIATYEKWWEYYTLTDAVGRVKQPAPEKPSVFDFGLMVQTVAQKTDAPGSDPRAEEREKTERLPVLEGIRKYADDHVLLVGRPGSGKSTALIRLLLEEANAITPKSSTALTPNPSPKSGRGGSEKIPVLVELRYWQDSIEGLIQGFLQRHGLTLDSSTLSTLLGQGRFLLLIDGLNELPSESARTQLSAFRRNYPKVPMIFTTRDLGLGGDLGIEKKLEMQPLTEPQMKDFIRAYVPDQAEAMLRQLSDRLREFGQTPLLLWMLCEVFQQSPNRQMPTNLAEVFRIFTKGYEESAQRKHEVAALKGDVRPLSDRRLWKEALMALAARMMQGQTLVDFRVAIPRTEAERELGRVFAKEKFPARDILDDLLKYHLIQNRTTDQLEFRHQLIQEYYAAEYLLRLLPELTDEQLKRDYLNYLKWTEPIALMLALVDVEAQGLRVVKLAIKVDFMLGATLAGKVQLETQAKTIRKIIELEVPKLVRIHLMGKTCSNLAIPDLLPFLSDKDFDTRYVVAQALGNVKTDTLVEELMPILQSEYSSVRLAVIKTLQNISTEKSEEQLISLLDHSSSETRQAAITSLGKIGCKKATDKLLEALNDSDASMRRKIIEALGEIGCEESIPQLTNALEDSGFWVNISAVYALGEIGNKKVIPELIKIALSDSYPQLQEAVITVLEKLPKTQDIQKLLLEGLNSNSSLTRKNAVKLAGGLKLEEFKHDFMRLLSDDDLQVQIEAISALGKIKALEAKRVLTEKLKSEEPLIRSQAAIALGLIGLQDAFSNLKDILGDTDPLVRANAAYALSLIGKDESVKDIVSALTDPIPSVRRNAILTIKFGEFDKLICVSPLLEVLGNKEEEDLTRSYAAEALTLIGTIPAISASIHSLQDSSPIVRRGAIKGLRTVKTREVIQAISEVLHDEDEYVQHEAASALGEIGESQDLALMKNLLQETGGVYLLDLIASIQTRYQFYNYEIWQEAGAIQSEKLEVQNKEPGEKAEIHQHFHGPVYGVAGTVEGNQIISPSPPSSTQPPVNPTE